MEELFKSPEFFEVYMKTVMDTVDESIKKDMMSRAQLEMLKRIIEKLKEENQNLRIKLAEFTFKPLEHHSF